LFLVNHGKSLHFESDVVPVSATSRAFVIAN
jgi:hypothetical protein